MLHTAIPGYFVYRYNTFPKFFVIAKIKMSSSVYTSSPSPPGRRHGATLPPTVPDYLLADPWTQDDELLLEFDFQNEVSYGVEIRKWERQWWVNQALGCDPVFVAFPDFVRALLLHPRVSQAKGAEGTQPRAGPVETAGRYLAKRDRLQGASHPSDGGRPGQLPARLLLLHL